jgi:hypothetical protein
VSNEDALIRVRISFFLYLDLGFLPRLSFLVRRFHLGDSISDARVGRGMGGFDLFVKVSFVMRQVP